MSVDYRQQLARISQAAQVNQIAPQEVAAFMQDVRYLLAELQGGALSANNQLVHISQQLVQVYNSQLSQEHQFELTLLILPGIFAYKYNFGASLNLNLRNLIDNIHHSWTQWSK
jgi:hypothetical protein